MFCHYGGMNSYPQVLSTGKQKVWITYRHPVPTCGYVLPIDRRGTLPLAARARRIARAQAWVLSGVLCVALSGSPAYAKDVSIKTLARYYINDSQEFQCFNYIVNRESHWNPKAANDHSTAYGIGQLLNEKSKDAFEQVLKAVAYGRYRYGTMCAAKDFHSRHGWW